MMLPEAHVCKWCGAPATQSIHVTDISVHPQRDYEEYYCDLCYAHEGKVQARLELRGEVYEDDVTRLMRTWLKQRGSVGE